MSQIKQKHRLFLDSVPLRAIGLTLAFIIVCCGESWAQQVPPTGVRPGDRPLPAPDVVPPSPPPVLAPKAPTQPTQQLPPTPPLSERATVNIKRIALRYADSKLSAALKEKEGELRDAVLRNYEKRDLMIEDIVQLRNDVSRFYYDYGFVNSGAVVQDQHVVNGILYIDVIPGFLPIDQIQINGLKHLNENFVRNRIARGVTEPLNVYPLQERLQLMLRDQSIDHIQARLRPTQRRGDSRLLVDVSEKPWFDVALIADNDRPPSVGEYQGIFLGRIRNVLGFSDPLLVQVSLTEGLRNGFFSYELPLMSNDFRIFAAGEITDADVVEEPFNILDIESKTTSVELGLRLPFRWIDFRQKEERHVQEIGTQAEDAERHDVWEKEVSLDLSLARRHSETFLRGRRVSFSPGVQDGESDVTVVRFAQNGFLRSEDQVFVARSTFSFGLDAWGATINEAGPDAEFFSWLGQAQWARLLPIGNKNTHLLVRGAMQLASDPLLPIEQFAVGGLFSARGYRRNELVRDNGWTASIEWRIPVFQRTIPGVSRTPEDGWVSLAPFFDAGGGWNNDRPTPDPNNIYSIGVGLLWRLSSLIAAEIYYGYPLNDVLEPEDTSLQDHGIYFRVGIGFEFDPKDVLALF
jgi:hemolysin activation/secretion protein